MKKYNCPIPFTPPLHDNLVNTKVEAVEGFLIKYKEGKLIKLFPAKRVQWKGSKVIADHIYVGSIELSKRKIISSEEGNFLYAENRLPTQGSKPRIECLLYFINPIFSEVEVTKSFGTIEKKHGTEVYKLEFNEHEERE